MLTGGCLGSQSLGFYCQIPTTVSTTSLSCHTGTPNPGNPDSAVTGRKTAELWPGWASWLHFAKAKVLHKGLWAKEGLGPGVKPAHVHISCTLSLFLSGQCWKKNCSLHLPLSYWRFLEQGHQQKPHCWYWDGSYSENSSIPSLLSPSSRKKNAVT